MIRAGDATIKENKFDNISRNDFMHGDPQLLDINYFYVLFLE